MPDGLGGYKYIIQAIEPNILWVEADALKKLNARSVAKFIYANLICRFGCIPVISMDGGLEFKEEVLQLLHTQYRCKIVLSTPYHPQGSATVEQAHIPLVEAIVKLCGDHIGQWPKHLAPALFVIRVMISRSTGCSPFYLLYGTHPVLSFDLAEATWLTLDWDLVNNTVSLLATCILQLKQRDPRPQEANKSVQRSRQRAIDNLLK